MVLMDDLNQLNKFESDFEMMMMVVLIHDLIQLNHRHWPSRDGGEAEKAKNLMKESERELWTENTLLDQFDKR